MSNIQAVKRALKILDSKGASDAVVSSVLSRSSQIKYSENKINATKDWDNISLNIFASFGGRIVTTSIREGWGITILEANACGIPSIAYDVPGLRESIIDGKTGLIVPYGNFFN